LCLKFRGRTSLAKSTRSHTTKLSPVGPHDMIGSSAGSSTRSNVFDRNGGIRLPCKHSSGLGTPILSESLPPPVLLAGMVRAVSAKGGDRFMVEKASRSIGGGGPEIPMFCMEKVAVVSMKKDPGENGCDVVSDCIGESWIPIVSKSNSDEPDDDVSTTGALPFDSVGVLGGEFGKCLSPGFIDKVVIGD
jgi:hypothetical protein